MLFRILITMTLLTAASAGLSGCGGGSGGALSPPRQAVMTLSAVSPKAVGLTVGAIGLTLHLPKGVSVKTDAATGEVTTGSVSIVSTAPPGTSLTKAIYTPVEGGTGGTLQLAVLNAAGFGSGDFLAVRCDVAPGFFPRPEEFSLTDFDARDLDGAPITGLAPTLTADIT